MNLVQLNELNELLMEPIDYKLNLINFNETYWLKLDNYKLMGPIQLYNNPISPLISQRGYTKP